MKYQQIKDLDHEKFRRLTGIKRSTFNKMIKILTESDAKKKSKGGRNKKLAMEDQLLMALEYIIPTITINYAFKLHLFGLKLKKKTFCIS